jgi:hypothetical protein
VPRLPPAVEQVVLRALAKVPEERFGSVQEFAEALEQAYRQSIAPPKRPRPKRRKRQPLLREAAGLLGTSLLIGATLGIVLRALGLELEIIWLLLVLLLIAFPLIVAWVMGNQLAFCLMSCLVIIAAIFGLAFHSPLVFLAIYGVTSLFSMLVTFSLGLQDESKGGKRR